MQQFVSALNCGRPACASRVWDDDARRSREQTLNENLRYLTIHRMKIKSAIIAVAAAVLLTETGVKADGNDNGNDQGLLFRDNEVSLDLFGTYLNQERHLSKIFDTDIRHGHFGGGVGLNYFSIKYVGDGADTGFQSQQSDIFSST